MMTEAPITEAKLRFMCEQLREWGGLPEDEIRRIYEAESKMWSDPSLLPDNRRAICAGCGCALQCRPDSPSQPMKLCIPCATGWAERQ